ncbi:mechanosensitive ion channel family protein [Thermoleptolyngbya sichuanensis]|uniref:mechanosensitive ion channel family protein n=1 Tax=Thermoleptolyngbya sichuanensis TaxID=2885951 RepID=UPI001CED485A|nr:mechanosensitive ion channel family protein [Thermoleptolyngbya sichuanensis]
MTPPLSPALGQLPSLPTRLSNPAFSPPDGVSRHGEYETAPIRSPLDNKWLFEVTSPTIFNREDVPQNRLPVEVRAQEVNARLWRVLSRAANAKETPKVTIAILNNRPVLQISDDQTTRPIRLVTVTEPDSDWNSKPLDELAKEWQDILQNEMVRFKQLTSKDIILQRLRHAFQLLVGLLLASGIIWFLQRLLTRRQRTLEARYEEQLAAIASAEKTHQRNAPIITNVSSDLPEGEESEAREIAELRSHFLEALQAQFSVKRQLDVDKFLKWALFWIFILMWYVGIARIISTVPLLMRWSVYVWATPLALLAIWFGISLLIRISRSLIDRFLFSWKINGLLPIGETQRIALRTKTISEALKGLITFVLILTGIVWTLGLFNIPTSSILAGGAVIGLAISFGSQSLIKDLVNGCLILIEDQFAVGDVVKIGDKSGLVERLNLRVTQLRNSEGQLITIPNSSITNVCNLTRLWSRVDFSIIVAYENDPVKVLKVLKQVSEDLYNELGWRDRLIESPDVLGIDELDHTGMLVRVWIKTLPLEQWSVGREFRLRVRQAFEANQIQIGKPQWITYSASLENLNLNATPAVSSP